MAATEKRAAAHSALISRLGKLVWCSCSSSSIGHDSILARLAVKFGFNHWPPHLEDPAVPTLHKMVSVMESLSDYESACGTCKRGRVVRAGVFQDLAADVREMCSGLSLLCTLDSETDLGNNCGKHSWRLKGHGRRNA